MGAFLRLLFGPVIALVRALARILARILALLLCLVALHLPWGGRHLVARLLANFSSAERLRGSTFVRLQLRFWNYLILGVVFYLGMPLSKLLLVVTGRSRLAPKSGARTYWVERESGERLAEQTKDPF